MGHFRRVLGARSPPIAQAADDPPPQPVQAIVVGAVRHITLLVPAGKPPVMSVRKSLVLPSLILADAEQQGSPVDLIRS